MVNTQELQGSWNQVKGQVKEKWGSLTDDDLQLHGGNLDQIVGKIQQKTGETREAVEGFLNDLTSRSASALSQAAETAGQYAQRAGHQIADNYQRVAGHVGEGYEHIERHGQAESDPNGGHVLRRRPGSRRTGGSLPEIALRPLRISQPGAGSKVEPAPGLFRERGK